MTKPRYPHPGCAAGSQAHGEASSSPAAWSPSDNAWVVNFNNGNSNDYHRDNKARVRAVRVAGVPGEYQGAECEQVSLRSLYEAWRAARRNKRPSTNQLAWESNWIDRLFELQQQLTLGTWQPGPSTCFVATRPKAREIHAPDFGDRVVHHWLVPQLEAVYERSFIHDSHANRKGKGTHAAANRVRTFVRQVQSGQGGGWYLQLDVHNFFYSVHRPTLWTMLKRRLQRQGVSRTAMLATHALLRNASTERGVVHLSTAAERAAVPAHKRLENAPAGRGLPIGNLSSQFFGNVYLDALDQFVKHTLKAGRYVRYVDDFVLVHQDRAQLDAWRVQIDAFVRDQLKLSLKADVKLRPLAEGIDFLGYVIYPTHTMVRRRVAAHARQALLAWERAHVERGAIVATPAGVRAVRSTWSSYLGHFQHANARRLVAGLRRRFGWLANVAERSVRFDHRAEGKALRFAVRGPARAR